MDERIVVNASPMIALLGLGREDLLPALFDEVLIPEAVLGEIDAGRAKDANVSRLASLAWVKAAPAVPIPESVQAWGLGGGESSVLAVAVAEAGCPAMLDDLAARRCARFLGLTVMGTGRLLVLAKQRGLIGSVREQLDLLTAQGFRLSQRLVLKLLQEAREASMAS
jgi:predicted nucleic acid-binding protein